MPNIAAINIGTNEAIVVTADSKDGNIIELTEYFKIPIEELREQKDSNETSEEESSEADKLTKAPFINFSETEQGILIKEFLTTEVDSSLALIDTDEIMYREIETPFNDTNKIDKIAPLQIQDEIPLEIEEYFLDSLVLKEKSDGTFDVMTSLVPTSSISETISIAQQIGTDPKTITTKANAVAVLKNLFPEKLYGDFVLIEVSRDKASIAVYIKDSLVKLRDISFACDKDSSLLKKSSIQEILCLIMSAENKFSSDIAKAFVISSPAIFEQCRQSLNTEVKPLDLNTKIINKTKEDIKIEDISWAIGLAANELQDTPEEILDFRSGPFAHRHIWKNLKAAFKEEIFFITLACIFCITWLLSMIYGANSDLNTIENQIKKTVNTYLPNENLPYRREVSTLETNIEELEEQLRGMGSLSSLSPLETLNELSNVIPKTIDIEIDNLNITESRLSFRGTVADTPSVGRLNSALEQNDKRFCEVKVDPKGKLRGSSRVRFSSEIRLCE